jgi:hypothetical protein
MKLQRVSDRQWEVDSRTEPGILRLTLRGRISVKDMTAFVTAHNAAIDNYQGADYKVLCDLRELSPLPPECAELLGRAKAYSDSQKNFRGSAVWVANAIVSMQHARTSKASGVLPTELSSSDEAELRAHLAKVWRK